MRLTFRRMLLVLVAAVVIAAMVEAGRQPGDGPDKKPAAKAGTPVEVRFLDGSVLKLTVLDERLTMQTPYGKVVVPLAAVRSIDFATRIPEDAVKPVEEAIAALGSDEFRKREDAAEKLFAFGASAYPALLDALTSSDKEVVRRAEEVLSRLRDVLPEEHLEVRKQDIVATSDSKFTGKIEAKSFKANTVQFGAVTLNLHHVRSLRNPGENDDAADAAIAQADPGSLTGLQDKFGKRFVFRVKGAVEGSIYGTDIYTTDSSLATAAVHAGVLKVGQTGLVRVKIVAPPAAGFPGTTRNGVTSTAWTSYPAAFQILK